MTVAVRESLPSRGMISCVSLLLYQFQNNHGATELGLHLENATVRAGCRILNSHTAR
jgi:hypothetical protein